MAPMKRTSKRLYWNYGMLLFDKYLHGFLEKVIHWTIWYILNCCHRDVVRSHATYPLTRPPQQKRTKNTFQTLWKPINPHASFCFFHMTIKQKSSKKQKNIEKRPHFTRATFQENDSNKKKSPWWHLAKKGGQKISAVAKSVSVALSNGTNLRSKGSPAQANWDDGNGKVSKLPKMPWGFSPKAGYFLGRNLALWGKPLNSKVSSCCYDGGFAEKDVVHPIETTIYKLRMCWSKPWGGNKPWKIPIMVLDQYPNRSLNLAPFPVRHVLADLHVSEIRSLRSEAIWRSTMAVLRCGQKVIKWASVQHPPVTWTTKY